MTEPMTDKRLKECEIYLEGQRDSAYGLERMTVELFDEVKRLRKASTKSRMIKDALSWLPGKD